MLRPRKKYTVYDLQKLKGKRCLTHIHVKSPEEAAAAEEAGIDIMSCSFDSPEAQKRLPRLVEAAPRSFFSCATPHGLATQEEAIRIGFKALEWERVHFIALPVPLSSKEWRGSEFLWLVTWG